MTIDQICDEICSHHNISPADIQRLISAFTERLSASLSEDDSIVIPGFGTFSAEKRPEYVDTDSDGSRTLMPPRISVVFTPSVVLRNKLSK